MKTQENNKLIAEFMGLVKEDNRFLSGKSIEWAKGAYTDLEALGEGWLLYNTSWSWLMEVIQEIEKETEWVLVMASGYSYFIHEEEGEHPTLSEMNGFCSIEDVYQNVVNFIQWFNEQK